MHKAGGIQGGKDGLFGFVASLNLTSEQKTTMDAVMAQHEKEGCNDASEAKYMREAKTILTPEQYAKFEAECKHGEKEKTTS